MAICHSMQHCGKNPTNVTLSKRQQTQMSTIYTYLCKKKKKGGCKIHEWLEKVTRAFCGLVVSWFLIWVPVM